MRTSALQLDREMIRKRSDGLDVRFLLLTLLIGAAYTLVIWRMSALPVPEPDDADIRHMQRQFAGLYLHDFTA